MLVDVAAVVDLPSDHPQRQHAIDDRQIERAVDVVVAAGVRSVGTLGCQVAVGLSISGALGIKRIVPLMELAPYRVPWGPRSTSTRSMS